MRPAAAKHTTAIALVMASSFSSCLASATSRLIRRCTSWTTAAARSPDLILEARAFSVFICAHLKNAQLRLATGPRLEGASAQHLRAHLGGQLKRDGCDQAKLGWRTEHHHPPPQRHAWEGSPLVEHLVKVRVGDSRRLREPHLMTRHEIRLSSSQAQKLAGAVCRHLR